MMNEKQLIGKAEKRNQGDRIFFNSELNILEKYFIKQEGKKMKSVSRFTVVLVVLVLLLSSICLTTQKAFAFGETDPTDTLVDLLGG